MVFSQQNWPIQNIQFRIINNQQNISKIIRRGQTIDCITIIESNQEQKALQKKLIRQSFLIAHIFNDMSKQQYYRCIETNEQNVNTTSKRIKYTQQIENKRFFTQKRTKQSQMRKNKSAQFHRSIAKQQKQQLFSKARQINHIKHIHSEMNQRTKQYNTRNKRLQFIDSISSKMDGQPNQSWRQCMNQLLWSIKAFYMHKEIHLWINRKIVDKLCETLDKRFIDQNLWHKGAYLLQKIIFLQPQSLYYVLEWQQKGLIVKRAYKCSLQKNSLMSQFSNCVQLIATMMSIDCKQIINIIGIEKAIKYCIKWLQRLIKQDKPNQKAIRKVYRYLTYLSEYISHQWQSLSKKIRIQVNEIIQLLNQTVKLRQSFETQEKLIIIIYNLTRYSINYNPQTQSQFYLFSPNLPSCKIVASKTNILYKIMQITDHSLYQTVKIIIRILQYSVQCQSQPIQFEQMLKRYLQEQKFKPKNHPFPNLKTTNKTIPLINNFISYLLIIFNRNLIAKTFILKINSFFKQLTTKIISPQIQQNDQLNQSQQQPEEIQI